MGRRLLRSLLTVALVVAVLPAARAGELPTTVRIPISIGGGTSPNTVVVEKGDHLWKISAAHLADRYGRKPASAEVAPYWVEVIEENRATLRSGDPDLIYPGEVVELPAISERR